MPFCHSFNVSTNVTKRTTMLPTAYYEKLLLKSRSHKITLFRENSFGSLSSAINSTMDQKKLLLLRHTIFSINNVHNF